MHPILAADRDNLPALIARASAYATAVLEHLDSAPVAVPPRVCAATTLTPAGIGAEEALRRFGETVAPSLSASAGPRYLGLVTGGTTPAALLGDWLAAVFDQNPVSRLDGSTALQLERATVTMLRTLFGLPVEFAGSFVSGATMSNFVGLALAREWAGRTHGICVSDEGLGALPRIEILAATPHSSSTKALSMLGLGRSAWQKVACLPDREAVDLAALQQHLIGASGPCVVIASAGTVNTGDFDDFRELARLKERHRFWLHVDAAFGGFASLSPALQPLLRGWECADSICVDLHKWLNVPYDSAVVFTRHRDLQADVFSNFSAYLGRSAEDPEPIHLVPENSHRWRALPAWFSLTAYGAEGHREIVERDCLLARRLGERIQQSESFDLLAPVRLNIVCFALRRQDLTEKLVAAVWDSGQTFGRRSRWWLSGYARPNHSPADNGPGRPSTHSRLLFRTAEGGTLMNQTGEITVQPRAEQATALLVIDVQQGLFRKSTPIFRAEPLLDTITTLVGRARAAGVLVVYVQHASDKVLPFGSADWQLHPRLHLGEGDLIVHKQHGNAFEDTSLHSELAARGVGRVIVTGLVTHGCVKATCEGALALGYAVVLAGDGHSSYSKGAARLVEEWNRKLGEAGARVMPAAQIGFAGDALPGE